MVQIASNPSRSGKLLQALVEAWRWEGKHGDKAAPGFARSELKGVTSNAWGRKWAVVWTTTMWAQRKGEEPTDTIKAK
jgi:hypothetical protein